MSTTTVRDPDQIVQLGCVLTTWGRYREVSRMHKSVLAQRIAANPGHVYPPLSELQQWTKDELIAKYIELNDD